MDARFKISDRQSAAARGQGHICTVPASHSSRQQVLREPKELVSELSVVLQPHEVLLFVRAVRALNDRCCFPRAVIMAVTVE